ncbi:MAG: hypothetical protein ACUVXE_02245 [Anaerolineae bacterium]
MGEPENPDDFVRFEADDLTVYVSRKLLETLKPGAKEMIFYVDGYGRFALEFQEPWDVKRDM